MHRHLAGPTPGTPSGSVPAGSVRPRPRACPPWASTAPSRSAAAAGEGTAVDEDEGGVFYDLGRPVIGGWTSHGPQARSFDPIRGIELMWGCEYGQEGAVLWAADVQTGEVVEQHELGARQIGGVMNDPRTDGLFIYPSDFAARLLSWTPQSRTLTPLGFPPISGERFASCLLCTQTDRIWAGTYPGGRLTSYDIRDITTKRWADHGAVLGPTSRAQTNASSAPPGHSARERSPPMGRLKLSMFN